MNKLLTILFLCSFVICNAQTRYYLNTGTTSPVSPAANAGWNVTTGAIRYQMSEVKDGSTLANNTSAAVGAVAVRKVLIDQWVSLPLAAQTITGTLTGQIRYDISSTTSTTGQGFCYLRIISNDGTSIVTEVGTMTTTNLSTTTTNRTLISLNVGTLNINAGERICIDIGWNYSVGTNTARTAFISTGSSSGTDLPADNTATAANDPWLEFSDNITLQGTDYYVATTGNDGNAGTIGSPFRNWQKLTDVLQEGDRGWVRGGTYAPTTAMTNYIHCHWANIQGTPLNPITISNYQLEVPIYDFAGAVCTEASGNTWGIYMENCDYLTVTGLRVRNIKQVVGGAGVSRGWAVAEASSNNTFNYCTVDSMGGTGFQLGNDSHNNVFNYCDSYNNSDPNSTPAYGGADGFGINGGVNSTPTYFNYCRAWWNSDDGYDNYGIDGIVRYNNSWAFWNGYRPTTFTGAGNGAGFKLGPTATDKSTDTLRFLNNCLAFENFTNGFDQNDAQCLFKVYNTTSYKNVKYGYEWAYYGSIIQDFKNNCAFDNTNANIHPSGSNIPLPYNSWNGTITVSNADFLSVSSTGMDGAVTIGGSLPNTNFLKLATGSDLINAGTNVGYGTDVNWSPFVGTTRYVGRIF